MIPVNELSIGDRLRFDNPLCMGNGTDGVVASIVTDEHMGCPIVNIRWDCHGLIIGCLCPDGILHEWVTIGRESLNDWMEAK